MKPLTQQETDQLLILLRKLWKKNSGASQDIARVAKSLFALITREIYESYSVPCQKCGQKRDVEALICSKCRPNDIICKRCGKKAIKGTREATRDFVFSDICISCNMKERS